VKALVKEGGAVRLASVPDPAIAGPDDVRIRVAFAGVCRTDVFVADGRLPSRDPVVLGHELSGVVDAAGPASGLSPGDRVTAAPLIPCGRCQACRDASVCGSPEMLGVARHGAFAELVCVPAAVVHRVPDGLPLRTAAYTEPVAAALSVLHAGIAAGQRGLVQGGGRIAWLVHRVLRAHGFERVDLGVPDDAPPASAYDFAVETGGGTAAMRALVDAVRPGGLIVLRSRLAEPVGLDLLQIVPKELTFRAVHYGPFPAAVALLASGRLDLCDVLAPARPLEDHEEVLAEARRSERAKLFFAPSPELG
jgi:L-iditol 2-dehydrogenase